MKRLFLIFAFAVAALTTGTIWKNKSVYYFKKHSTTGISTSGLMTGRER